jgi:hypothetical protein
MMEEELSLGQFNPAPRTNVELPRIVTSLHLTPDYATFNSDLQVTCAIIPALIIIVWPTSTGHLVRVAHSSER